MRQWLWLYPSVEIVHIVGIGLLFGSIAVLDLRLLGLPRSTVRRLASHVLPWTAASFILIIPSGLAMFTAHATEFVQSEVFVLKMLLISPPAQTRRSSTPSRSAPPTYGIPAMRKLPPPPLARAAGAISLGLWISVIACGRLLAYSRSLFSASSRAGPACRRA